MKILMVAAENAPYARVGGLSQVVYFLSRALVADDHDVRVFMPKYGMIDEKRYKMTYTDKRLMIPTGESKNSTQPHELICNVKIHQSGKKEPVVYFLENREYYELRSNVYAYKDDEVRFFLLARGVLEWLLMQQERSGWIPDLIHCHDWHTGYVVSELRRNPRYKSLKQLPILYSIHNFKYQGPTNFQHLPEDKRDDGKKRLLSFFDAKLKLQNPMLRGILNADWISTVSKTHALEVQTPEYGETLEDVLKSRARIFSGILNGLDLKEFNPARDKIIAHPYSPKNLTERQRNKLALQKLFHLPVAKEVPVFSFVGRLVAQKGIELIIDVMPHILKNTPAQLIIVGTGDDVYLSEIKRLCQEFPKQVAAYVFADFKLPRKIYAGADMILIPSKFEPAGIVPMEAERYGCIPIASRTGGLTESVQEFDPAQKTGSGFLFTRDDPWDFYGAITRALYVYHDPKNWQRLIKNTMAQDFSWKKVAKQYEKLYTKLINK